VFVLKMNADVLHCQPFLDQLTDDEKSYGNFMQDNLHRVQIILTMHYMKSLANKS
jgi:hypothetical protein